ncbi:MAG: hypothetical protein WA705_19230 [Candidatus Ozemobacteraceae bacterium]
MKKLLSIRLLCLKTGCQEIFTEYDVLKEDQHSLRISMADHTGEADERNIKKKWIGEITEYALGDEGVEFKLICLPEDKTESITLLRSTMMEYISRLRDNLNALEKAAVEFTKGE